METLRCGVIGAGAFAEACHLPGLLAAPGVEVVALCGRRRERAATLAARFGVRQVCADAAELVARDDLDAVAICTPNAAHREHALLAFAHGKHVFCEKPLGLTLEEAAEMTAAARASGRVHMVAFTYRYLHGVEELRRRVAAGDVGEPFLFRAHHEFWDGLRPGATIGWRELQAPSGGGVLWDSGSHFFDLARFILGPVAAVRAVVQRLPREAVESASSEPHEVETDDLAACWLRFAGTPEVRGHWHASRITPSRGDNHVQVVGREGALEALLSRGRLDRLRALRVGERDWQELPLPEEATAGGSHALTRMMDAFVAACRRGAPADTDATFSDGLAVQRLLAAAEESSRSGLVEVAPPAWEMIGGRNPAPLGRRQPPRSDWSNSVQPSPPRRLPPVVRPPRRSPMSRAAGVAALACDGLLIAAFAAWGWSQAFPQRALPPQVASVVVVLSLACGAVGLIAARRSNRIGVFLFTLLAVLAGAWLWSRLQTDLGPVVPRTLLVR